MYLRYKLPSESLQNDTPADVYYGKAKQKLKQRSKTKTRTLKARKMEYKIKLKLASNSILIF